MAALANPATANVRVPSFMFFSVCWVAVSEKWPMICCGSSGQRTCNIPSHSKPGGVNLGATTADRHHRAVIGALRLNQ
jgi:hypothetical protein